GGAQSVQPVGEGGAIAAEFVQIVLQQRQLFTQQQAQRAHRGGIAAAVQGGTVVEYARWGACLGQGQHTPQVGQRAWLEQGVAEAGVEQAAAFGGGQLRAGGHRDTFDRGGLSVAAQLRQYPLGTAARHAAVQQQQVESFGVCPCQRRFTAGGGVHHGTQRAQAVAQETATARIVVGHQHAGRGGTGGRIRGFRGLAQDEILVVHQDLAEWPDMRPTSSHSSSRWLLCCGLLLGLCWLAPARADVVLSAKSISVPGLRLDGVTLRLGEDDAGAITVQLQADRADLPSMGWRRLPLELSGNLRRDERMSWVLDGKLKLAGAPGGALGDAQVQVQLSPAANTLQIDVLQGKATVSGALPLDRPSHAQIRVDNLPAGWLQGLLGTVWSGRPTAGRLSVELALDMRDSGLRSSGQFNLKGVGFDTPSGTLAGQGVNGSGRFNLDSSSGPAQIDLDASLHGGELLLGPIYAKLPDHTVQLGLHASAEAGAVELSRLRISDP